MEKSKKSLFDKAVAFFIFVASVIAILFFSDLLGSAYAFLMEDSSSGRFNLLMGLLFFFAFATSIVVLFYFSENKYAKGMIKSLLIVWGWYFSPIIVHWIGMLFKSDFLLTYDKFSLLVPFIGLIIYGILNFAFSKVKSLSINQPQ